MLRVMPTFKWTLKMAIAIYLSHSLVIIVLGAHMNSRNEAPFCKLEFQNIEYLIPAFRIGCWLGEPDVRENK